MYCLLSVSDVSPGAGSFVGSSLSCLSLSILSVLLSPTASSFINSTTCIPMCSSRRLTSSSRAGDRANWPWCSENAELHPVKEKTVGDEEFISPTKKASLEDGPRDRGGEDSKEFSWMWGEWGWSWGRTSHRNLFSSQRKENVCEEAELGLYIKKKSQKVSRS